MINVTIGGATFPLKEISEGWVSQMIAEARKSGRPVCVRVQVRESGAHLDLATMGCASGYGGGRRPTELESRVLLEWERRGLHLAEFPPGQLNAFLRELERLV